MVEKHHESDIQREQYLVFEAHGKEHEKLMLHGREEGTSGAVFLQGWKEMQPDAQMEVWPLLGAESIYTKRQGTQTQTQAGEQIRWWELKNVSTAPII